MRLADFIKGNRARIVDAWLDYAEALPPFEELIGEGELRVHAGRMLDAVVSDMRSSTRPPARSPDPGSDTDAIPGGSEHGLQRHAEGLSLVAITSEFRAVRAVVLRLWAGAGYVRSAQAFDDLVAFNESLDRVTAAAVMAFAQAAERDRALLMGIVAHDLRGPMQTVSMASHILAMRYPIVREDDAMGQIRRSLARMLPMVDDLMSVAAAGLRNGMAVQPQTMDLAVLAAEIVSEVSAEFPDHWFVFDASGPTQGIWDRARLGQLISNLLRNAAAHGDAEGKVRMRLVRQEQQVVLSVHNTGPVIPEAGRVNLFSATARGSSARTGKHLGLGLFIVKEIAQGHGGAVDITSDSENGTVFSVVLPCSPAVRRTGPEVANTFVNQAAQPFATEEQAHPDLRI